MGTGGAAALELKTHAHFKGAGSSRSNVAVTTPPPLHRARSRAREPRVRGLPPLQPGRRRQDGRVWPLGWRHKRRRATAPTGSALRPRQPSRQTDPVWLRAWRAIRRPGVHFLISLRIWVSSPRAMGSGPYKDLPPQACRRLRDPLATRQAAAYAWRCATGARTRRSARSSPPQDREVCWTDRTASPPIAARRCVPQPTPDERRALHTLRGGELADR